MIVVSVSGGRTSSYMAKLLIERHGKENLLFVFANTGKENNETLDFIRDCSIHWGISVNWVEADVNPEKGIGTNYKMVTYETASRNGEPFVAVNQKYGIPNKSFPHCTRELKEVPIRKFVKDICGDDYEMAIGIRADERTRLNMRRAEKEKWIYPLVFDWPTTRQMVNDFWSRQPFQLGIPDYLGNCDLCWKKSQKKRLKIIEQFPEKADWWEREELKDEYVFDRDGYTIKELRKMANEQAKQISLFDLSSEIGCSCFSNLHFD